MAETFKPTEEAKAAFHRMRSDAFDAVTKQFFDIWEAEGEPQRAGSMAAHAMLSCAARVAVFGAQCAGIEPQRERWREACDQAFTDAVAAVAKSFEIAGAEFAGETTKRSE